MCVKSSTNKYYVVVGDDSGMMASQAVVCDPTEDFNKAIDERVAQLSRHTRGRRFCLCVAEATEGNNIRLHMEDVENAFRKYRETYMNMGVTYV